MFLLETERRVYTYLRSNEMIGRYVEPKDIEERLSIPAGEAREALLSLWRKRLIQTNDWPDAALPGDGEDLQRRAREAEDQRQVPGPIFRARGGEVTP
jgi:hypothetical protein